MRKFIWSSVSPFITYRWYGVDLQYRFLNIRPIQFFHREQHSVFVKQETSMDMQGMESVAACFGLPRASLRFHKGTLRLGKNLYDAQMLPSTFERSLPSSSRFHMKMKEIVVIGSASPYIVHKPKAAEVIVVWGWGFLFISCLWYVFFIGV